MSAANHPVIAPKKLIEVALPLDAINAAAAREKSIRQGHPSTLHLYWARRPLAAARAVLFAQLVNDPSWRWDVEHPGENPPNHLKATWAKSRRRLFGIIEDLVAWENTTNTAVLEKARAEVWRSWRETCEANAAHPRASELFDPTILPAMHDPFAGGGAIPIEAQRLGLSAFGSDLNPVAVLLNKAAIEIPPRFAGRPPVSAPERGQASLVAEQWFGVHGLAEDIRSYGAWLQAEAWRRISYLYPPYTVTEEMAQRDPSLRVMVGDRLTVVAWLWARTVETPNPAFRGAHVPLTSTFVLSSKSGREVYVEPVVSGDMYQFELRHAPPDDAAKRGTRAGKAQDFVCLLSGIPISRAYIRDEGRAGRIGSRLLAVVAEGPHGRVYLPPTKDHETITLRGEDQARVEEARKTALAGSTPTRAMITGGVCSTYGFTEWATLFTERQLAALTLFSDLIAEVENRVVRDAIRAGLPDGSSTPGVSPSQSTAQQYGAAVATYLACAISKVANIGSSMASWMNDRGAWVCPPSS